MTNCSFSERFPVSPPARKRSFIWAFCILASLGLPVAPGAQPEKSFDPEFYIQKVVENVRAGKWGSVQYYNAIVDSVYNASDSLARWITHYSTVGFDSCLQKDSNAAIALTILLIPVKAKAHPPHSIEEWKVLSRLHLRIGYIYNQYMQNPILARDYYESGRAMRQSNLPPDNFYLAYYVLHPLGNIYAKLRDFDRANHYLQTALAIYMEDSLWTDAAKCCSDIGLMFITKENYQDAIHWFQVGLNYRDISPDSQIFLLLNLGLANAKTGKTEEGLRITMEAKELLEATGDSMGESHRYEHWGDVHGNLGQIYANNRDWQQAAEHYKKDIEYYRKKHKDQCNRDVAQSYYAVSQLYNEWGRPDSALRFAQLGLHCLLPRARLEGVYSELPFSDIGAEHTFYLIFEEKIRAYHTLARQFPADTAFLVRCLAACDRLLHTGELLRQEYVFEPTKLYRQEANRRHFETALSACWRLWELTQNKHWVERAFQYADLARERVQLEGLQKQHYLALPDLPQHRLDSLRNRLVQLQIYHFEKSGVLSARQKDSLQSEVFYSTLAYQEVLDAAALEANDPARNPRIPWVDLSAVKNLIQPEQVLVEYFLGDSDLYVFMLTSETIQFWRMDKPADLDTTLRDFLHSITDDESRFTGADVGIFASASSRLFDWLLAKPLQSLSVGVNKLVIVPDGILCRLPFELLGKAQGTVHFKTFPYLIRRYIVSYAYSSDLLLMQSVRARQAKLHVGLKWFAGFAAEYAKEDLQRSDISLARRELAIEEAYVVPGLAQGLKAISGMMGGTLFTGFDASERTFKQQARQYRILHFFLHAYVDEQNPLFSKLLFTLPNSGENSDDGDLNAIELYDMNLPAEMVVLSACNTGGGILVDGEGVMSLSRAFSMAGVPTSVMSLWLAPSEATAQLMTYFYTFLQTPGTAKDEALRKAKLKYIEQAEKPSQPYYWAGFITAGAMQAIY